MTVVVKWYIYYFFRQSARIKLSTPGTAVTHAPVPFIFYKSLIYWRDMNLAVRKFILVARFVLWFPKIKVNKIDLQLQI